MSEVKRHTFKGAAGEYVYANDFDRVTAERDALQVLLTAADERADELERDAARYRWLRDPDNRDDLEPEDILVVGIAEGEDIVWLEQMDQAIDANLESLNPAGGGGHD